MQTPSFQFSELAATVPEREVPRHRHETPHFVLVLRGTYVTEARNQSGPCSASTLIFNPSGTKHRDRFLSRNGKFLSISPDSESSRLLDRASLMPHVVERGTVQSRGAALISASIGREFAKKHPAWVVLEGLGLELIGHLARLGEPTQSSCVPSWLLRTKEMIEDCAGDGLCVTDLAAVAAVHPVYLARVFRRHFGTSPGEYLRRRRLLRVQQLLADTRVPLVEIALTCGFPDQSRMTHAFTSEFGISPGLYRRRRLP